MALHYSEDLVNEVLAGNDIVDVVSQYVQLRRSGTGYTGLCPFHKEKTPSFHVSADKQLYHCFGCGEGGSVIQFLMKAENLDFIETLKLLADKARITLPEETQNSIAHEKKQLYYKLNCDVARFYFDCLTKDDIGKNALSYIINRKLTKKTIISFGIGFAPNSFDALKNHLLSKGYSEKDMLGAGVVNEKDGRFYDKFRNRLMFPIFDLRNNLIAFGGRVMDDSMPKYLNSPETSIFSKSNNLFALNIAKGAKEDSIILVEGYMDTIALHQAQITNTVATLGTALTEQQAKLLIRYCKEIILCYDTDDAGQKATLRAIDIINSVGGRSKVLMLKDAKDPDEFLKKYSVDVFRNYLSNAIASIEYRINIEKKKYDTSTLDGKVAFINSVANVLVSITDMVELDAYVKKLSQDLDIKPEAIYSNIKKINDKKRNYNKIPQSKNILKPIIIQDEYKENDYKIVITDDTARLVAAEKMLICLIATNKKVYNAIKDVFSPHNFFSELCTLLSQRIYDEYKLDKFPNIAVITASFDGDIAKEVSSIFCKELLYEDEIEFAINLVKTINEEKLKRIISYEKDPIRLKELLEEKRNLSKQ